jgi:hypothetical protein
MLIGSRRNVIILKYITRNQYGWLRYERNRRNNVKRKQALPFLKYIFKC